MRYSVEAGGQLANEFFLLSKNYKRKMIRYFRSSEDTERTAHDKDIKEAGLEIRKKIGYTFVSDIQGNYFQEKTARDFVISQSELPVISYVNRINLKERQKCKTFRINNVDLSKLKRDFVLRFARDVEKKKYYRDLKTEFPPENIDINSPFRIVVGRIYDKK